jgi:adenine-specific DNA methylase
MSNSQERMIDRWFPVAAVDEACGTTVGSGKVEKAIFPWFASRPLAQARAAALTSLLPNDTSLRSQVIQSVALGNTSAMSDLRAVILKENGGEPPLVLDLFSGRGIIPLEAARAGARAVGIDLSPVATFAGRLLADYPSHDWSKEPSLPFAATDALELDSQMQDRLVSDVSATLREVGERLKERLAIHFPRNSDGNFPWAYVWCTTILCDECKRRFPLLGSLQLRKPYKKTKDLGQSIRIDIKADQWDVEAIDGPATQEPTYCAAIKADGKKKKGKLARCVFCSHVHTLDTVKAKGFNGEYQDALIFVADEDSLGKRRFRKPGASDLAACEPKAIFLDLDWPYEPIPSEDIPQGNVHTVMASGYGYKRFGDLMCNRQTVSIVETIRAIRDVAKELTKCGISDGYVRALIGYCAAALCRRLKFATRGVGLLCFGDLGGATNNNLALNHVFSNESSLNFQFDFAEAGPDKGPGTWSSVCVTTVQALAKVRREMSGQAVSLLRASATALPLRDASVDVVITDPPYYDMIEYADASDYFYVWLKRLLFDIEPDLFGPNVVEQHGLQDKNQEIIVRRVHEPGRVKHDTLFYEYMLAKSFGEARRVLRESGHLVVIFGHSDPDAWRRLLGALQTSGFIVTSAWPSRTETKRENGAASIKVTVTIGCRVAPAKRPVGMTSEVDREVVEAVTERVKQWDVDGLALEDQLMASYGPAMEVYGHYSRVLNPDGSTADLDHYLGLARRAVRDAMRLRIDELPLETFDAITRFAIFWLRAKGRTEVPKGEARFFAQADELRLDDLRDRILIESKAGFKIELQDEKPITAASSVFEVVRAMAHAWDVGGMESVANVMATANLDANNDHLWAVVADLANHLPASDKMAKALAGIRRSFSTISTLVANERNTVRQSELFDSVKA